MLKAKIEPAGGWDSLSPEVRAAALKKLKRLALDYQKGGNLDAAFVSYQTYLAQQPKDAWAWTNVGSILRKRGEYRAAVSCQQRAAALAPGDVSILHNLCNALIDAEYPEQGLTVSRQILVQKPDETSAHRLAAICLRALNRHQEAIVAASEGLALAPDDAHLFLQRAMAHLALGEYRPGFRDMQYRWDVGEIGKAPLPEPEWMGEPLTDKCILVMPEQGFGDTLLMARFLPNLKALGARVLLGCKQPLWRLFVDLDSIDGLFEIGGRKPTFDFFVSAMDLPYLLGIEQGDIPPPVTVAVPDDARQRAADIVDAYADSFRVGVVWSGSVTNKGNHKRSFDASLFMDLADIDGVQLFSLYKGPLLDEFVKTGTSIAIVNASAEDRDFADTAALIEKMDLVITVDSAVAHLAGALRRPVWNLLQYSAYWVYGVGTQTTPWYDSMRLYRQPGPGDWPTLMAGIVNELRTVVQSRGGASQ